VEAEAIHGGHRGLVGDLARTVPGDQPERCGVIGIHVLDDSRGGVHQGIGAGARVVLGGDPAQMPKQPARYMPVTMIDLKPGGWSERRKQSNRASLV
jgi:hypothetical protein